MEVFPRKYLQFLLERRVYGTHSTYEESAATANATHISLNFLKISLRLVSGLEEV